MQHGINGHSVRLADGWETADHPRRFCRQPGDVITKIDDQPIKAASALNEALVASEPGQKVAVTVRPDAQETRRDQAAAEYPST